MWWLEASIKASEALGLRAFRASSGCFGLSISSKRKGFGFTGGLESRAFGSLGLRVSGLSMLGGLGLSGLRVLALWGFGGFEALSIDRLPRAEDLGLKLLRARV